MFQDIYEVEPGFGDPSHPEDLHLNVSPTSFATIHSIVLGTIKPGCDDCSEHFLLEVLSADNIDLSILPSSSGICQERLETFL